MVAMNVWPTDGSAGSVATEAKWRKMSRHWAPTGVVPVGNKLKPTLAGTNLTIADGACWIDGHFAELTGSQVLTVTANGLAVVRFDPAANTADLVYRDGVSTPAQDPVGIYEMPVAQITASALVDKRVTLRPGGQPATVWTSITGTTDAAGFLIVTAAQLGLATIVGAVAVTLNDAGGGAYANHIGEVVVADPATLKIRFLQTNLSTNDVNSLPSTGGRTAGIFAWGTV